MKRIIALISALTIIISGINFVMAENNGYTLISKGRTAYAQTYAFGQWWGAGEITDITDNDLATARADKVDGQWWRQRYYIDLGEVKNFAKIELELSEGAALGTDFPAIFGIYTSSADTFSAYDDSNYTLISEYRADGQGGVSFSIENGKVVIEFENALDARFILFDQQADVADSLKLAEFSVYGTASQEEPVVVPEDLISYGAKAYSQVYAFSQWWGTSEITDITDYDLTTARADKVDGQWWRQRYYIDLGKVSDISRIELVLPEGAAIGTDFPEIFDILISDADSFSVFDGTNYSLINEYRSDGAGQGFSLTEERTIVLDMPSDTSGRYLLFDQQADIDVLKIAEMNVYASVYTLKSVFGCGDKEITSAADITGNVTVTSTVTNNTNKRHEAIVIYVLYKDNEIKDCVIVPIDSEGTKTLDSVTLNAGSEGGYSVKVMIWNNLEICMPFCDYTELK